MEVCLLHVDHDLAELSFSIIFQLIIFYDNRKLMTLKLKEAMKENKRLTAAEKYTAIIILHDGYYP
jgi:hypothetical protein